MMKAIKVLVLLVAIASVFSAMPFAPAAEPEFSNIPLQPADPGSTVILNSSYSFDTGLVAATITQNGVERVSTFNMDKNHMTASMATCCPDQCAEPDIYANYSDGDEVAQLSMTVIFNKTATGTLATEGLSLKLLVYEIYGNNVTVVLSGKRGGAPSSLNCSFAVSKLTASRVCIGALMQPPERNFFPNESIPIYAMGYNSTVEIIIKDGSGAVVASISAEPKGMLAYGSWKVPQNQPPGSYSVSVKPNEGKTDGLGAAGNVSLDIQLEKAPKGTGGPRPPTGNKAIISMPVWAPYAMVAAVLIVAVPIGVLLIRKKKD